MRISTKAAGILVATTALLGLGAGVALADTPAPAGDVQTGQFKMFDNAKHRLEITGYSDPSLFASAPRVGTIINPGRGPATIVMSGPAGSNLTAGVTFTEIADNQAKTSLGSFTMFTGVSAAGGNDWYLLNGSNTTALTVTAMDATTTAVTGG